LKALRQAIGVKSFRNTQSLIVEGCLKDFSQIRRNDWCLQWAKTVPNFARKKRKMTVMTFAKSEDGQEATIAFR